MEKNEKEKYEERLEQYQKTLENEEVKEDKNNKTEFSKGILIFFICIFILMIAVLITLLCI